MERRRDSQEPELRCGRWRLKPFELLRPVLLRPHGPLTLGDFLAHPEANVAVEFCALGLEEQQALVLSRIRGAPPNQPLALFGRGGYTFADVVREVEQGTPLGVRIIEAECKLVGLLLTEALSDKTAALRSKPSAGNERDH